MKFTLTLLTPLLLAPLAGLRADDQVAFFELKVRPLLVERCFNCHGEKEQESGLRVDSRAALLKGGDFGAAIVPGDAVSSYLMKVVTSMDEDVRMPPEGERLSVTEVDALKKWIEHGAVWPGQSDQDTHLKVTSDHWSFQPLATTFAHHSIDGFVVAKLAENGLQPSSKADRRTLIRRVTLDLTGLPPAPEDVEAFVHDQDPRAYENLVERLLQSPSYGERWAQHWLDVIRYADTRGYEYNSLRGNTWPFRDWVIDALNRDLPYDQFIFQQLAGDTVGVDPATGFLVTAPLPTPPEVGEEPKAIKAAGFNAMDEVVQNVSASMLGLTVGCARCHNHKFDPIGSRDYYRMVSTFAGLQYESRPWRKNDEMERALQLANVRQRITEVRNELAKLPHRRESPERVFADYFAPVQAKFVRMTIEATDATSEGPAFDEIEVWSAEQNPLPSQPVSRISQGGQVTTSGAATQLGSKDEFINDGVFGNPSLWVAAQRPPVWVQIELAQPSLIDRIVWSRDRDLAKTNRTEHARRLSSVWRIEVAEKEGEWREVVSETRNEGLDVAEVPSRRNLEEKLLKLNEQQATLSAGPQVFAGSFTQPELIHVLQRGDPQQPRDPVGPGGLEVLNGTELPGDAPESERRVAFAQWLTTQASPLTSRVAVNRVWHHHFGNGLVDTPSDFGKAGSLPTHPELLDWLAKEFTQSGWSLKTLHKRLVMSATYQQSSEPVPQAVAQDASSRLLWRFPPRRLEADTIRDSMLAISGSLDLTMGGEGVNLYTRQGRFDQWKPRANPGPESLRRMIYLTKIRGADDGMFKAFDLPDCGQVRDKRVISTTPLQALNLLNGPFTIGQSRRLAERVQREVGTDIDKQIERVFALVLARPPSEQEHAACLATAQVEDLAVVCRALYNSNEFLFLP